jgi:hypothetical protein
MIWNPPNHVLKGVQVLQAPEACTKEKSTKSTDTRGNSGIRALNNFSRTKGTYVTKKERKPYLSTSGHSLALPTSFWNRS